MQFLNDLNEKKREFQRLVSREKEMVLADPTRDKVREFEKYHAEKASEFNNLCDEKKHEVGRLVSHKHEMVLADPTHEKIREYEKYCADRHRFEQTWPTICHRF